MVFYWVVYVENLGVVYGCSVWLHNVHKYDSKWNMYTINLSGVACLDKYEVECCYEGVVVLWDEGVMKFLDNNNKYYFDVGFLLPHPLE